MKFPQLATPNMILIMKLLTVMTLKKVTIKTLNMNLKIKYLLIMKIKLKNFKNQ